MATATNMGNLIVNYWVIRGVVVHHFEKKNTVSWIEIIGGSKSGI